MSRKRKSRGLRLFWILLEVALAALVVGGVAAAASHGDLARGSTGTAEVARVGMLMFLAFGGLAFVIAAGGAILEWRAGRGRPDPAIVIFVIGLAIGCAALVPIVAIMPTQPGRRVVYDPFLIPLYLGAMLAVIGVGAMMAPAIRAGVGRRDPAVLIGLLLLAGIIAVGVVRRA
jgi:hypothetical protein